MRSRASARHRFWNLDVECGLILDGSYTEVMAMRHVAISALGMLTIASIIIHDVHWQAV